MLTKDTRIIKKIPELLWDIYRNNTDKYIDLFFYEKEVFLEVWQSLVLNEAGIVRKGKKGWIANVMIFPFNGKLIATDFLFSVYKKNNDIFIRSVDDVWPMYPFETLSFIKSLKNDLADQKLGNKLALDLASGSGAISLFLADKFERIISSDINPKAISYARFNSILNNLENRITNVQSDIFSQIKKYKFDYIIWNGPTGAFPEVEEPNKYYPQYVYGGADGTKFTKKFLNEFPSYVKNEFKVKFLDCSLGNNREALTESYIKNRLSDLSIGVKIEFLNKNGKQFLKSYQRLYDKYCVNVPMNLKSNSTYMETNRKWKIFLKDKKLNYVYFSYISIKPSNKFTIEHIYPQESSFLPRHNFGFEWHYASRNFIKRYLKENN